MIKIIGLILVISGIGLGIYFGVFVLFIGGILQFFNAFQGTNINTSDIVYGICKIYFSGIVGWSSFIIISGLGICCLKADKFF